VALRVLVVNAGSSTVKLRLLDGADRVVGTCDIDPWEGGDASGISAFVRQVGGGVDAVGHRVVHGGGDFTGPVLVDAAVRRRLEDLTDLAPLHQPRALAAIDATAEALRGVPAVACFDTAFHTTLPDRAATYALPGELRRRWGIRRFGFHGLSHAYAARRAAELVGEPVEVLRTVTCHLGAGASLAAVDRGRSVDTTMGFTPLDGLVMATRSGSVDPGLLLWLLDHTGLSTQELSRVLEEESGLRGLAELPDGGDMRAVRRAAERGHEPARLALAVYVHRLRGEVAAMCAAMGGLDVLAFTGGIGEHDTALREETVAGLGFLGVALDLDAHRSADGEADVSAPDAPARTVVVTAREDVEIARQTRGVLLAR
jgi:acetate kinase